MFEAMALPLMATPAVPIIGGFVAAGAAVAAVCYFGREISDFTSKVWNAAMGLAKDALEGSEKIVHKVVDTVGGIAYVGGAALLTSVKLVTTGAADVGYSFLDIVHKDRERTQRRELERRCPAMSLAVM